MPPIGETLREARLRREIDIAEVEQATKIRAKYLRALEGEEFDRLPGSTFVRTFLRTYAEYLGLDSQLLVEEYRARHEPPADEELQPFTPPPPSREGRRRLQAPTPGAGRGVLIAAAAVGVLALLLVIGLLAGDGDRERERPADAGAREERNDSRRGDEGGQQSEPKVVTLEVTPLAETYVCAENAQGEELINATIVEPETFRARVLRLNLGNTLAVEMTANGEDVPLEESANPVGLEITPEGQEEIPEEERPCQ